MVESRADRRDARRSRVAEVFEPSEIESALDLLELVELAWHDCYAESTPPERVVEDILLVSGGDLGRMISATRLAVVDWRDLRVAADELGPQP